MIKFFHKLFNPHCDHCAQELRDSKICPTCEVYRAQLELVNHEKKLLLATIEKISNPVIEEKEFPHTEPIQPKNVPWAARKRMLEAEDRVAAEKLRARNAELKSEKLDERGKLEELEKEVGIG